MNHILYHMVLFVGHIFRQPPLIRPKKNVRGRLRGHGLPGLPPLEGLPPQGGRWSLSWRCPYDSSLMDL